LSTISASRFHCVAFGGAEERHLVGERDIGWHLLRHAHPPPTRGGWK
jgi:hypothetical protein